MSKPSHRDLRREDFQKALREFDTYLDITLEDLMQLDKIAEKHARLRESGHLTVREIMTSDIMTVTPDTSLSDAARILVEKRISGLPVTDNDGKLVGVVTEADFLCAMGIPCHHPTHSVWQTLENLFRHPPRTADMPSRVSDIMVTRVVSIQENQTLDDVIEQMKKHHIKRVIVTDDQEQVNGIITRSNLVQVLLQQML
ncbi:MAG: CBS domain-containing protein [Thiohalophilus sp.]|uniref:CBS domain-containing protein n=1 Tax=Thiohalophilus sp. TaxID=3028392 RepID=UPI00287088B8|nr:CBS domain-containing protein [Thiohalophilus sp.]MDR9435648.1 CBS domain-containing protein [Thiohalophilus sp.]